MPRGCAVFRRDVAVEVWLAHGRDLSPPNGCAQQGSAGPWRKRTAEMGLSEDGGIPLNCIIFVGKRVGYSMIMFDDSGMNGPRFPLILGLRIRTFRVTPIRVKVFTCWCIAFNSNITRINDVLLFSPKLIMNDTIHL